MKILITGGAGYIGSTVATACNLAGLLPVVLDDLSAGVKEFAQDHPLYIGDIADGSMIDRIITEHPEIHAVVHCAARTVVPESIEQPLTYYINNVAKGTQFLQHLRRNRIDRLIFSSSASIYRMHGDMVVDESSPLAPSSPYANTKAMFETVLRDITAADGMRAISLRYFNPIGADPKLRTGVQNPKPTHALGKLISAWKAGQAFTITGVDWPTRDGSGVRDYIHVWDLARAHVAAIRRFDFTATTEHPYQAINIATGRGVTVRELVAAFERVVGESIQVTEAPRRAGDSAGAYSRNEHAAKTLGWHPELGIDEGIRDALAWAARLDGSTNGAVLGRGTRRQRKPQVSCDEAPTRGATC